MSKSRENMTELEKATEALQTLVAQRENQRDYNNKKLNDEIVAAEARIAELSKPANDEIKAAAEKEQADAEKAAAERAPQGNPEAEAPKSDAPEAKAE